MGPEPAVGHADAESGLKATQTIVEAETAVSSEPPLLRRTLLALHLLLGTSAVAAGQALTSRPSGETFSFDVAWLGRSPFPDYRIPGLFLAIVIGGSNLASAALQWRRSTFAPFASLSSGVILVTWITIQTVIIGNRHWSQVMWAVTFATTTLLAALQLRRGRLSGHAPQA